MVDSILDRLRKLPIGNTCLYTAQGEWSIGDVINESSSLRDFLPDANGARIAICGLDVLEFIKAIIAFDGMADLILLLPAKLDLSIKEKLIREVNCTHSWGDEVQQLVSVNRNSQYPGKTNGTRWVLATSGTTGVPKLIEHSLASLTRNLKLNPDKGSQFRWGLMYDPSRFAGLQVVLQALLGNSSLILPSDSTFNAQVQSLVDYRVNALSATPTLWRKLLMDNRIRQIELRQITLGGEIVDQAILDALRLSFTTSRITHIYASTEAGTGFAVNDGLAGFPLKWLDPEVGQIPMRIDDRGHLLIKPTYLPSGQEVSKRLDTDGYFDTEDQVRINNGRVFFLGRASGAINVGGNKVNPELIEQSLRRIDGVADAKVYAKKSSFVGQLVAADIVPTPDSDKKALRQEIRDRCLNSMEGWQIPAFIRFVLNLDVTTAGKLERMK